MKEILGENLVSNTVYYMQHRKISGNGKQKGIFVKRQQTDPTCVIFYEFKNVNDVVRSHYSGYGCNGTMYCQQKNTIFYIPEKETILYNFAMNAILKKVISDEYFIWYYVNQFHPTNSSITQSSTMIE